MESEGMIILRIKEWLFEYAAKFGMTRVLQEVADNHPDLWSLSECRINYVFPLLVVLNNLVHKADPRDYPVALDLVEHFYEHFNDCVSFRVYTKLQLSLKMMVLFDMLKKDNTNILSRLNTYFPNGGLVFKHTNSKLANMLMTTSKNFRRLFMVLVSRPSVRKAYMEKDYEKNYGATFKEKMVKSSDTFIESIRIVLPPSFIERILQKPSDAKLLRDLTATLSSSSSSGKGQRSNMIDILMENLENYESLNDQRVIHLLELFQCLTDESQLSLPSTCRSIDDSAFLLSTQDSYSSAMMSYVQPRACKSTSLQNNSKSTSPQNNSKSTSSQNNSKSTTSSHNSKSNSDLSLNHCKPKHNKEKPVPTKDGVDSFTLGSTPSDWGAVESSHDDHCHHVPDSHPHQHIVTPPPSVVESLMHESSESSPGIMSLGPQKRKKKDSMSRNSSTSDGRPQAKKRKVAPSSSNELCDQSSETHGVCSANEMLGFEASKHVNRHTGDLEVIESSNSGAVTVNDPTIEMVDDDEYVPIFERVLQQGSKTSRRRNNKSGVANKNRDEKVSPDNKKRGNKDTPANIGGKDSTNRKRRRSSESVEDISNIVKKKKELQGSLLELTSLETCFSKNIDDGSSHKQIPCAAVGQCSVPAEVTGQTESITLINDNLSPPGSLFFPQTNMLKNLGSKIRVDDSYDPTDLRGCTSPLPSFPMDREFLWDSCRDLWPALCDLSTRCNTISLLTN